MKKYKATGYVYGRYWGGGEGAYKSEKITSESLEGLLNTAQKMLDNGSLDSGMGCESLIGAILDVEEIETIEQEGKEYTRSEYESHFIGNLTEEQEEFLMSL